MVSVCLASYNGERFIREQIDSILAQIGSDDELVVSDDGSSDKTPAILEEIQSLDKRLVLIQNKGKHGCISNFQNALSNAKGDYIFLSDQDDVWLPSKYEEMLKLLESYDLVCSDSVVVDENLNELKPSFFKFYNSGKGIIKNIIKSTYFGSCMAFKSSVLKYALPFPPTSEIGHDLWLGLVSEVTGKVCFYDKPLILYRRSASSFCDLFQPSGRSFARKLYGRIQMMRYLTVFIIKYKFGFIK